jgi:alcohol dehydrogenase
MRAVVVDAFGTTPVVRDHSDPAPSERGVVVRVEASGLCRSDIHGWLGHDDGIVLPYVPGHELVGVIESVGPQVSRWQRGQRVTTPFVCACGRCPECASGNAQVCRNQTQPGFTHDGSFAELVALHEADVNLVAVPADLDAGAAALLGCRFATAYRGVVQLGRVAPGETMLVFGCGGVGLSAVMIGAAYGARVVAVDVDGSALARARQLGAGSTVDIGGLSPSATVEALLAETDGEGADLSVDALGRAETIAVALRSLRRRGRHVQIGLLAEDPVVPLRDVIAKELSMLGVHGLSAASYPDLVAAVRSGRLRPQDVLDRRITLDDVPAAMAAMVAGRLPGVTVVEIGSGSREQGAGPG